MAASRPDLTPDQREAIYALKKKGKSGTEIQEACARGTQGLDPFSVSAPHANTVARRLAVARGELYSSKIANLPDGEALDLLTASLIGTAEREVQRQDQLQKRGRLDAGQVGKLALALERLYRLTERRGESTPPPKPEEGESAPEAVSAPPTLAETLIAEGGAQPAPEALGDVVVGAQGGSFARSDRRPTDPEPERPLESKAETVPPAPDPPHQDQGPPLGSEGAAERAVPEPSGEGDQRTILATEAQ